MRKLAIALLLAAAPLSAQQNDILRQVAVLKLPGMESVDVRKNIKYDAEHAFDLYLPPRAGAALPLVVFVNGVGVPDLKEWGQYTSWPRLAAARGMAAIAHQTTGDAAAAQAQTEALLRYVREHANELKIDPARIALWACSANVRVATAMLANRTDFRAAVLYYGIMSTDPKHAETPLYVARAGLDVLTINESIDAWVAKAVALDAPITLVTYPQGRHGFDLVDDTAESRRIVGDTIDFLHHNLTNPPPPRTDPVSPAQLQRLLREQGSGTFIARVRELHKTHPNAVAIQEQTLNTLGYVLLQEQKLADAVSVFELVTSLYPESANAYDSLGDAYEASGKIGDAIAASERALALLDKVPPQRRENIRRSAEEKLKRLKP